MAARMFAGRVSQSARSMFSDRSFRLVSNGPLSKARSVIQEARMSTMTKPKEFVTERNDIVEWLPPLLWKKVWDFLPGIAGYLGKKGLSTGVVNVVERLTKKKNFKVRKGRDGITIQAWASGFSHEDLKFEMVKKKLLITGETKNLLGKTINYGELVPVGNWKRYDIGGLVAESKYGMVKIFIPVLKK